MATKQYLYTTPGNYTYDTNKIEVSGGLATLKEDLSNVYARWHLNESSGTNVPDSSGNGRNGTTQNMEDGDWVAGKLNNCLQFDGSNESVNLGNIANFEKTDPFTLEAWFSTTQNTQGAIISREIPTGSILNGYDLYINTGKITFLLISDVSTNDYFGKTTNATFKDGNLHHLVVSYDGSNNVNGIIIYIDGSPVATESVGSASITGSTLNTANCSIGSTDNVNRFFNGKIDEVVIYDDSLTPTEVTYRYNSGNGRENWYYYSDKPTIEPTTLFDPATVDSWDSFLETLGGGNQGSIGYNLYKVNKANKYYWSGSAWVTGGSSSNYNSQAVINTNIGSFDGSPDKIGFIAYLISDGEQKVELDENQITYTEALPPSVNAGSNKACKDHETIKPFSDAVISDPDGDIENATAWYDIEGSGWTQIPKGGYGTLQEAIREWQYTFDNLGTINCKLKIIDEQTRESEDNLDVIVSKYTRIVNIKNSITDEHLSNVLFDPGDGTSPTYRDSPFSYSWEYSSFDIVMTKLLYYTKSQTISVSDESDLNLTLIKESVLDQCRAAIGLITETDTLAICTWLETDGQMVDNPTSCEVWLYDSNENLKYHPAVNTISNVFGAFHFSQSPSSLADDEVYCLKTKIIANGNEYITVIAAGQIRRTVHDLIKRTLGLTQENFRITNPVYDSDSNMTSCRIKIYPSAVDCENDTNALAEYDITATYDGVKCTSYKSKKVA